MSAVVVSWYAKFNTNIHLTQFWWGNLQTVPTGIPHRPHITYKQFQPVYHTVHTSPTNSSNRYTTQSTHHLQTVPTGIPHRPHITYKQFQPVYHTVHTAPTRFIKTLVTTSSVTPHRSNKFNSQDFNHCPF